MKKLIAAVGGAALMSLALLSTPAQAQARSHGPIVQVQYYVAPPPPRHYAPPPPPRYAHPGYYPHGPRYHPRHRHWERRHGMRDNDRDGVPNRYDRRPNNPYRY